MTRAACLLLLALAGAAGADGQPRNVVLILSDDHRHDFFGAHPNAPAWLETPALDRMAREGAHVANAFVGTALCSPSRATILTGQRARRHGVVDNARDIRPGAVFFPQLLQQAGYRTAFVGKWHMGDESDAPRPGFDHWVSFRGGGVYENPVLNVDGARREAAGYTTDVLTDHALGWLRGRGDGRNERPFFLMLAHKAVHAEFVPAPRHAGRYAASPIPYPPTMARTEANVEALPRWARAQRYGWHGVEHAYHGAFEFDTFYRRYAETLLALDESVGRVLAYLDSTGLAQSTLVVYTSDNGFSLGEHGLIDKRHAYEESMRVPMFAWAPGYVAPGTVVRALVENVDLAPTFLALAGREAPPEMDGRSFLPLLRGEPVAGWRDALVYQYFWEYNYPHTPTTYALREARFKYIFYHGVWDRDELFDLDADPAERFNLARLPAHRARADSMRERLFDRLEAGGTPDVRFARPRGGAADERLSN